MVLVRSNLLSVIFLLPFFFFACFFMFLHYSSWCFLSFSSCFSCSPSCCCTGSSSSLMVSDDGRSIWFSEGGIGGSSTYSASSGGGGVYSILIHVVFKLRWWCGSDVDDEETWNEGDGVAGIAFVLRDFQEQQVEVKII